MPGRLSIASGGRGSGTWATRHAAADDLVLLTSAFPKLDVRLIHAPTAPDSPLVLSEYLLQQRQKLDRPAADTGMIHVHTTFLHHFFQVAVAQWVRCVPTDAQQNDFLRKSHPLHLQHRPSQPLNFRRSA